MEKYQVTLELESPIFIQGSFALPIYNEIFSKELLNILDWFISYVSDKKLISNLSGIILEINQINSKLLLKNDFDGYAIEYTKKCTANPFTRKEFEDINVNAKFNFVDNYARNCFLTKNNEICIGLVRRQIENYCRETKEYMSYSRLMFIDRFLMELICANRFIAENITNM